MFCYENQILLSLIPLTSLDLNNTIHIHVYIRRATQKLYIEQMDIETIASSAHADYLNSGTCLWCQLHLNIGGSLAGFRIDTCMLHYIVVNNTQTFQSFESIEYTQSGGGS